MPSQCRASTTPVRAFAAAVPLALCCRRRLLLTLRAADLGVTQMRMNLLKEAQHSFIQALKIKPGEAWIRENLDALVQNAKSRGVELPELVRD